MRTRRIVMRLLLVCSAFASPYSMWSTTLKPVTPHQLVNEAEFIFQGLVTRIEYRLSARRAATDTQMPHTFVTFTVERVLKGKSQPNDTITLRFQGGPEDQRRYLMIPGIPHFDLGDRDILFVRQNGERMCPLVGWMQGRFRILGDIVLTDDGREVWLSQDPALEFGSYRPSNEVLTHQISKKVMRLVHSERAGEEPSETLGHPPGQRATVATFTDFVLKLVTTVRDPRASLQVVPTASVESPFYVRPPQPVRPPQGPSALAEPKASSLQTDLAEEELFARTRNPVFKGPRPPRRVP